MRPEQEKEISSGIVQVDMGNGRKQADLGNIHRRLRFSARIALSGRQAASGNRSTD
jgi:hypothetical protein